MILFSFQKVILQTFKDILKKGFWLPKTRITGHGAVGVGRVNLDLELICKTWWVCEGVGGVHSLFIKFNVFIKCKNVHFLSIICF